MDCATRSFADPSSLQPFDEALAAMVVLHRLTEQHFESLQISGKDEDLLDLLLNPIISRNRALQNACETIAKSWASHVEPTMGIRTLSERCPERLSIDQERSSQPQALKLVLLTYEILLTRMPAEIIEDELSHLRVALRAVSSREAR